MCTCALCDAQKCVVYTGWQRPIGCHQSQVIFRQRAIDDKVLLRKMTCKDKASYGSLPPCMSNACMMHARQKCV